MPRRIRDWLAVLLLLALHASADAVRVYPLDAQAGSWLEQARHLASASSAASATAWLISDTADASDMLVFADGDCQQYAEADKPVLGIAPFRQLQPATAGQRCGGLVREPSPADQLWLLQQLLPKATRIGILLHADNQALYTLLRAIAPEQLQLDSVLVNDESEMPAALAALLPQVDAILLFPDARLFNARTARHLLMASYRQRVPVIGPDEHFVDAGSLASVYLRPADVAAGLTSLIRQSPPVSLSPPRFVARGVHINAYVARTFGVRAVDSVSLEKRLEENHAAAR